jgi:hydrogenase maturation protein HypF
MERRAVTVGGIVQGVGFRPFVHNLAARLALSGFVRNQVGGVCIEVEGETDSLDRFLVTLARDAPPLAQIDAVTWEPRPVRGESCFHIEASDAGGAGPIFIAPDVATCPDCLAELFDPDDRRCGYPFLNCTNCGPRLTIVTGAPYDRSRTTMASFALCESCHAEYEDPANRRFHAQPTCCPACGPRLQALTAAGQPFQTGDPIAAFATVLRAGRIGALKGLGGYHLSCDAGNADAVRELRRRKRRDEKPFAVMVGDIEAARNLCEILPEEERLLLSSRRPIVLLRKRAGCSLADEVAPGNPYLGVMLPYTPLHHLLLRAVAGIPLVMTSGNRSDEPIAYQDEEALSRLADIADLFLIHDRAIHVRCDDSVTRVIAAEEAPIRRSRGYALQPIPLPVRCPCPILAVGGQLKSTFALGRDRHAFLSHHLGDLDHFDAYQAFVKDVDLYEQLLGMIPRVLAHDLHPDYASTRYVRQRVGLGEKQGNLPQLQLLAVQHHEAHVASCMAENGLDEPVIGVSFDGTGYGHDGTIWGGEFLVGDYRRFDRLAHLRPVGMPGGEQAIREPWRMALAHLLDSDEPFSMLSNRVPSASLSTVAKMLERRVNTPMTSSAGRLFDAVACLAGVRDRVSYEGQAAIELEWLATGVPEDGCYPFDLVESAADETTGQTAVLDTRPLIRAVSQDVIRGRDVGRISRRFHSTMVAMIAAVCGALRRRTGLDLVVLSGGVFLNALLTAEVAVRLNGEGFRVHRHRLVPPNDGGLSLGQLAIAARKLTLDPA